MPVKRTAQASSRASSPASLYVHRSTSNDTQDNLIIGISKEVKPLPAPETSLEQRLSTGILDLPRELRDHLISYLTPSSAVALKLTCRSLYHCGPALPVLSYLSRKNPESRYEWSLMQEQMGHLDGKLNCGGCKRLHNVNAFLEMDLEKKAKHRLCIGRRMVLELTPDMVVTFGEYQKNCRKLLRDTRSNTYAFGWFVYHMSRQMVEVPQHFPADFTRYPLQGHYHWMRHSEGAISVLAYLTLRMDSVDPEVQTCASIHLGLQKFPFLLCRHITTATKDLAKAIHEAQRRRLREVREERLVRIQCYYCGCTPRLEVNDDSKTVIIYARRVVGDGSASSIDWCEQAEYKIPGVYDKRAPLKIRH